MTGYRAYITDFPGVSPQVFEHNLQHHVIQDIDHAERGTNKQAGKGTGLAFLERAVALQGAEVEKTATGQPPKIDQRLQTLVLAVFENLRGHGLGERFDALNAQFLSQIEALKDIETRMRLVPVFDQQLNQQLVGEQAKTASALQQAVQEAFRADIATALRLSEIAVLNQRIEEAELKAVAAENKAAAAKFNADVAQTQVASATETVAHIQGQIDVIQKARSQNHDQLTKDHAKVVEDLKQLENLKAAAEQRVTDLTAEKDALQKEMEALKAAGQEKSPKHLEMSDMFDIADAGIEAATADVSTYNEAITLTAEDLAQKDAILKAAEERAQIAELEVQRQKALNVAADTRVNAADARAVAAEQALQALQLRTDAAAVKAAKKIKELKKMVADTAATVASGVTVPKKLR